MELAASLGQNTVWNIATKSLPVQQKVYCWRDLNCYLLNFIIKLCTEAPG